MKTFTQFLTESIELRSTQFPLLMALPLRRDEVNRFLAVVVPAIKAGAIPNPVFQDAKYNLSTIHGYIEQKISADHMTDGKWREVPDKIRGLDLTLGDPHHVPGKMMKLEKIDTTHPVKAAYLEYAKEFTVLLDALQSLKDKIVKRQPKVTDETKSPTYIPPMASGSAIAIVAKVLTTMTDDLKVKYANQVYKQDVAAVEHRIANPKTRQERMQSRVPDFLAPLMNKVGDDWDSREGNFRKLKRNYKDIVRKEADENADSIQQLFLAKNVRKLAKIIELKGNLKGTPTILHLNVALNGFSGEVRVEFEDGSEFMVKNKVVQKESVHGRQFLQFPTTFHDVKLSNGNHMAGPPSEKEMIEDFAGGSAADVPKEGEE